MNSQDKEAFEKWFISLDKSLLSRVIKLNRGASQEAWQAACEYKHKEIDELKLEYDKLTDWASEYVAENARLIDCVKFYADATNNPKQYMRQGYLVYNLKKEIFVDGGERARQCLKELEK